MNNQPTVNEAIASYEIVKQLVELGEQKDYKGSDESFLVRCCRIIKKAKEMELAQEEERKRHEGKQTYFDLFKEKEIRARLEQIRVIEKASAEEYAVHLETNVVRRGCLTCPKEVREACDNIKAVSCREAIDWLLKNEVKETDYESI